MNGLELSRAFFEDCGRPMLERDFPELLPYLAAGLFGPGSECLGYDDEVSRDHDFEPGFLLLLPEEALVDRRQAFLLERAYARLPREYGGVSRPVLQPVGGARHGVFRTSELFTRLIGRPDAALSAEDWLRLPEQALLEATNGEVFLDPWGEVTQLRSALRYYPEEIRLKKLAGHLLLMAQSGQYNLPRCLRHGEGEAARLALHEFVKSALSAAFLLARRYQPYYKWSFRALRELPGPLRLAEPLSRLLRSRSEEAQTRLVEEIAAAVAGELRRQELAASGTDELEPLAYEVNAAIRDASLRNRHILAGV